MARRPDSLQVRGLAAVFWLALGVVGSVAAQQQGCALPQAAQNAMDSLRSELACWVRTLEEGRPESARAWLGLGRVRLELAVRHALASPGPLQPRGSSYARGAAQAFMRALELDSTMVDAALLLPRAVDLIPAWVPYTEARDALRRTGSTVAGRLPGVLIARARYERESGVRDSTFVLLQRFLEVGGDSGVGCLELAREYFVRGESTAGARVYFEGAAAAGHTAEGRAAYRAHLAMVASPQEIARFDSVSVDSLGGWIRRFWSRRDAAAGRMANQRLGEHFRRLEYAWRYYRLIVRRPVGAPSGEILTRDRPEMPDSATERGLLDALFGDSAGRGSLLPQEELPAQGQFDARGPIYIRHGPPDYRVGNWWVYYRGGRPYYLSVVPANAMLPGTLCDVDPWFCFPPTPRLRQLQRETLSRMATRARATDDYAPAFGGPLDPTIQVLALHGPVTRPDWGRLLIVFAIPGDRVIAALPASPGGTYRVRFRIIATKPDGGGRVERDTLWTFHTPTPLGRDQYLTGVMELLVPAGRTNVSISLEQSDSAGFRPADARLEVTAARGALVGRDSVLVPRSDTLSLGELVLGLRTSGLRWSSPVGPVPVNPLAAFPSKSTATLYYEVSGLSPGRDYAHRITVDPAGGHGKGISLTFSEPASGGLESFVRDVILTQLRPGHYHLTISILSPDGRVQASGTSALHIVD